MSPVYSTKLSESADCNATHALAMVAIGPPESDDETADDTIPRITKTDMTKSVRSFGEEADSDSLVEYTGDKDPTPPKIPLPVLSEELLRQEACYRFAEQLDFDFLKAIVSKEDVPEYNGYMTSMCRTQRSMKRLQIHPLSLLLC